MSIITPRPAGGYIKFEYDGDIRDWVFTFVLDEIVESIAGESFVLDKCPGELLLAAGKNKMRKSCIVPNDGGQVINAELGCGRC